MRAVIIGAGKVGFNTAQMLSLEQHDVIVVESDEERAAIVEENLDVQVIIGNGASPKLQKMIQIAEADLVVAVTESDEVNMLACMLAKQEGVERTVARVRDIEYARDETLATNKALNIDLLINPEQVTASVVAELIEIPEAESVNYYANRKLLMLELRVRENNPHIGKTLSLLKDNHPFLIAAIVRGEHMIIPDGQETIRLNDQLFVMAKTTDMRDVEKMLGFGRRKVERVMLLGGGRLAFYLAEMLEPTELEVKVIEKNYERCEKLATLLNDTIILHGDASDIDLLREEGIEQTDILIALTEDDKLNVLVSLLASRLGAKKTVAQIRRSDYLPLIETVGIDVAVSPRILTAEAILKFVRKGDLESVSILGTGAAEVYEVLITEHMKKLVHKKLRDIRFPKGIIVAAIFRDQKVLIPHGQDSLQPGDRATILVIAEMVKKVEELIK